MFILVIACVSSLLAGAVPDPVWASYAPRRRRTRQGTDSRRTWIPRRRLVRPS